MLAFPVVPSVDGEISRRRYEKLGDRAVAESFVTVADRAMLIVNRPDRISDLRVGPVDCPRWIDRVTGRNEGLEVTPGKTAYDEQYCADDPLDGKLFGAVFEAVIKPPYAPKRNGEPKEDKSQAPVGTDNL